MNDTINVPSALKDRARRVVRTAISQGVLSRPMFCELCGDAPGIARDGRSKIHAHHHDYDKPLDVQWICVSCHRHETPMPSCERSGSVKLSRAEVIEIRSDPDSSRVVAAKYGIDKTTVLRIRRGKSWKEAI